MTAKKTYLLLICLLILPFFVFSQKCKPDYQSTDRITKAQSTFWLSKIYIPPVSLAISSRSEEILLSIGKFDTGIVLTVIVRITYDTKSDYQLDTPIMGEKGKKMYLGFAKGEFLALNVDDFANKNKVDNYSSILNTRVNQLVATTTFAANISADDLEKLKASMNGSLLNFIRIELSNGLFEREIKKLRAEMVKDKFLCFSDFIKDFQPSSLPNPTSTPEKVVKSNPTSTPEKVVKSNPVVSETPSQQSPLKVSSAPVPEKQNVSETVPNTKNLSEKEIKWVGKYKCNTGEIWTLMEDKTFNSTDIKGNVTKGEWGTFGSIFSLQKTIQSLSINYNIEKLEEKQFVIKNYTLKKTITCSRVESLEPIQKVVVQSNISTTSQKPTGTQTSSNYIGVADELLKYKQLVDSGLMTKQEFETQKKRLLNIETSQPTTTIETQPTVVQKNVETNKIEEKPSNEKIEIGDKVTWIDSWKKEWTGEVTSINQNISKVKVMDKGKEVIKIIYTEKLNKTNR